MANKFEDGREEALKDFTHISNDVQKVHSTLAQNMKTEGGNSAPLEKYAKNVQGPTHSSVNPSAATDYEEDYFLLWHKNHHGSIDLGLDEKLTSMTGSYSEILDENEHVESESDNTQTNASTYINNVQELCTKLEDKRKGVFNVKEVPRGATPKIKPHESPTTKASWHENAHEENVSTLIRDFSEKNSITSQSSKRKECLLRNMSSSQNVPRSLLYPSLPPVDPTIIADLEDQARCIATSMDTLIENLTGTLHSISALTVECVETYRDAVCKTCDAVDSNIKSMYQLMAKCEELSKSMKPVYKLQDQIKEIRRLLDLFEGVVYSGGT